MEGNGENGFEMGQFYTIYSLNGNWADTLNDPGFNASYTSALSATSTLSNCLGLTVAVDTEFTYIGTGICMTSDGRSPPNYSKNGETLHSCKDFCKSEALCLGISFGTLNGLMHR
eukprot:UN03932